MSKKVKLDIEKICSVNYKNYFNSGKFKKGISYNMTNEQFFRYISEGLTEKELAETEVKP